jgi:hypothetical protein
MHRTVCCKKGIDQEARKRENKELSELDKGTGKRLTMRQTELKKSR